jgi:hypothetical protein
MTNYAKLAGVSTKHRPGLGPAPALADSCSLRGRGGRLSSWRVGRARLRPRRTRGLVNTRAELWPAHELLGRRTGRSVSRSTDTRRLERLPGTTPAAGAEHDLGRLNPRKTHPTPRCQEKVPITSDPRPHCDSAHLTDERRPLIALQHDAPHRQPPRPRPARRTAGTADASSHLLYATSPDHSDFGASPSHGNRQRERARSFPKRAATGATAAPSAAHVSHS